MSRCNYFRLKTGGSFHPVILVFQGCMTHGFPGGGFKDLLLLSQTLWRSYFSDGFGAPKTTNQWLVSGWKKPKFVSRWNHPLIRSLPTTGHPFVYDEPMGFELTILPGLHPVAGRKLAMPLQRRQDIIVFYWKGKQEDPWGLNCGLVERWGEVKTHRIRGLGPW